MTSYLTLDGLKHFKTKQDSANGGKYVPQGVKINGVALNTADITVTDDTKLSTSDASTLYLTKSAASTTYLGISAKAASASSADKATKLAAAVTINGVSFDGSSNITIKATDSTARIASSEKGAANGVCPLGSDKLIPSAYLPSYVDDVIEGYYSDGNFYTDSAHKSTLTGETGKIYVDIGSTDIDQYRWSGSAFVLINDSVSTADKAVRDGDGNTIGTTYVKKETGKGLSTNDYTTTEKSKLAGIDDGANKYVLPAATSSALGGVKTGSNVTITSGVISVTSANVVSALGYTPADAASIETSTAIQDTEIDTLFASA